MFTFEMTHPTGGPLKCKKRENKDPTARRRESRNFPGSPHSFPISAIFYGEVWVDDTIWLCGKRMLHEQSDRCMPKPMTQILVLHQNDCC